MRITVRLAGLTLSLVLVGCRAAVPLPDAPGQPAALMFRGGQTASCPGGVRSGDSAGQILCYQEDGVVQFRAEDVAAIKYLFRPRPSGPGT